jgi:hypothetical protein
VKICQKCNFQNDLTMSFCLQCGSPLPSQIKVNFGDHGTPSVSGGSPTNFGQSTETQNFGSNFQPAQPPRPKNNTKIFLAVGGIGLLLLLFAGAGAAIVGYNILSKPKPTPYPTVVPTRTISPKPIFSPTVAPTVAPTVVPSVAPSTNSGVKPTGKFTKMWVDYDVRENNVYGMRIHTNFSTSKMKGVDSYLAIYFQTSDGSKLLSKGNVYRSQTGQVAVFKLLKPNFDETEFKDVQMFIPYTAFGLTPGKYDLQMDTDLIYQNGTMIEHLNLYDFEYEEFTK